ncbi:MAG TPA: polysaccharide deacetylase [Firmicutes bacterium]|nr:polysaccharide deacetylase [Bacillota bacterium]
MYHVIGEDSGSLQELYVSPEVFASQMEYLHTNGYHTITMSELYAHWQEGTPLPPRPIILTFDDGYKSDYELVFPTLRTYGFRAVHFLYVKKVDHANGLTPEEIAELLAAGHEIGNHTYNHIELHTASQQGLVKETEQAKTALEEMLDIQIVSFCYPVGRYNSDAIRAVKESGHKLAVTTEYGYASPEQGLLNLKRIRISRSDGLQGFIKKLRQYEEIEPPG